MTNGPRVLLAFDKFRVVELPNSNKVLERYDGDDAMGVQRWGEVRIGDADRVARVLRDWIFLHLTKCPVAQTGAPSESQ